VVMRGRRSRCGGSWAGSRDAPANGHAPAKDAPGALGAAFPAGVSNTTPRTARNSGTRPRFILASVKFLSRALTALNFDNVIDRGAEAAGLLDRW
jgi:hypothetical protein